MYLIWFLEINGKKKRILVKLEGVMRKGFFKELLEIESKF